MLWIMLLMFLVIPVTVDAHPLDTLAPGEWYQAPNTHLRPLVPVPPPVGSPLAIMTAWSGAAYDTLRNRLMVWGGGHGDYRGNELYAFDVEALTWSRVWGPTPNAQIAADLALDEVTLDGALVGTVASNGFMDIGLTPGTRYTYQVAAYDTLGHVGRQSKSIHLKTPLTILGSPVVSAAPISASAPATDPTMPMSVAASTTLPDAIALTWVNSTGVNGVAGYYVYRNASPVSRHTYSGLVYVPTIDRFWANGGSLQSGSGGMGWATWLFDPLAATWTRGADRPQSQQPTGAAFDPLTGHVFMSRAMAQYEYDPLADTWTARGSTNQIPGAAAMALDPVRRKLVVLGDGKQFVITVPATGSWPITQVTATVTGDTEILTGFTGATHNRPGIEYDPVSTTMAAWIGGADVYTFDVTTLDWTKRVPAGTNTVIPTAGPSQGTFGRWRYIPSRDVYVGVNSIDGDVYFYRPAFGR